MFLVLAFRFFAIWLLQDQLAELGTFFRVVVVSCSLRCCEIGEANRVIDRWEGCANALHIEVAFYILLTLLCLRLSSSLQAHFLLSTRSWSWQLRLGCTRTKLIDRTPASKLLGSWCSSRSERCMRWL